MYHHTGFVFTPRLSFHLSPQQMPEVNVTWSGDGPHALDSVHISIAVATERGLITPIIRDAANKGVQEISAQAKVEMEQKGSSSLQFVLRNRCGC